jgi:hypothetical protein
MYHLIHPLYPTFVVYLTTIGGRCLLCETNSLCKDFNILKNFSFGFNKYTNNFLFCQIYLKLFFVNLITSIFHHLLFHIYLCNIRNIFYITKFIFKKLFKMFGVRLYPLRGHTIGFIICWLQPIILNVR